MNLAFEFLSSTINRVKEYKALGDKTFDQLNDAEMLLQLNKASTSIAIIVQHLHGNMLSRRTDF
jgi:hypothetical protein